jgi:hypothetical protein
MQGHLKILVIAVFGFFFSIATLEIDAFGCDNTFFDAYDSYVHVENQVSHHVNKVDQGFFGCPEIIQSSGSPLVKFTSNLKEYFFPIRFYKRKLYLELSSLLI